MGSVDAGGALLNSCSPLGSDRKDVGVRFQLRFNLAVRWKMRVYSSSLRLGAVQRSEAIASGVSLDCTSRGLP
jgi:hypothetical protein